MRSFLKHYAVLSILILLSIISCKKNDLTNVAQNGSADISANTEQDGPVLKLPTLFCTYRTTEIDQDFAAVLATEDIITNTKNAQFQSFTSSTFPQFHIYNNSTGELWGVKYSNTLNRRVLVKYSLSTKTQVEVPIFPQSIDEFNKAPVREIIFIDEIKKKIYYLEGDRGNFAFSRLISCNYDGSDRKFVIDGTKSDIVTGLIDIKSNKFYYVSYAFNALVEYDLSNKTNKTLIKNFNLTGKKQFAGFKDYYSYLFNKTYLSPQLTPKAIDDRRLNLFTIDFINKKVFWFRNKNSLVHGYNNDNKALGNVQMDVIFDQIRPDVMSANLDGTNVKSLNTGLKIGDYTGQLNHNEMDENYVNVVIQGSLQVNPATKKLYLGYESIQNYTKLTKTRYKQRSFRAYETDYNLQNTKALLIEPFLKNPVGFSTMMIKSNFFDLWKQTDHYLFQGSQQCFILGAMSPMN